jgi:hypothetical protein
MTVHISDRALAIELLLKAAYQTKSAYQKLIKATDDLVKSKFVVMNISTAKEHSYDFIKRARI